MQPVDAEFPGDYFLKRPLDILLSVVVILMTLPLLLLIFCLIKVESKGPSFFLQTRVGRYFKPFRIYKFRTMCQGVRGRYPGITTRNDQRITRFGRFLRRYKFDEIPQFFNVLKGEMSIVGPRPEVPQFVHINPEEKEVLRLRPGITDWASLVFADESRYLEDPETAEKYYIERILPVKHKLNLWYARNMSLRTDLKIIMLTVLLCLGYDRLHDRLNHECLEKSQTAIEF